MKFNKEEFIVKHSQKVFNLLKDFLYSENKEIFEDLRTFMMNENLKSFLYEGNKYIIQKSLDNSILAIDQIAEENGVSQEQTRFVLNLMEFLDILTETKEIVSIE